MLLDQEITACDSAVFLPVTKHIALTMKGKTIAVQLLLLSESDKG